MEPAGTVLWVVELALFVVHRVARATEPGGSELAVSRRFVQLVEPRFVHRAPEGARFVERAEQTL